jgi:hypothetical protein
MRYEKPIVMDLSAGARSTVGQGPLSCMDGTTPGGVGMCSVGTGGASVGVLCTVGPAPGSSSPSICYSGVVVDNLCEAGTVGNAVADDCTVGPSNI